MSELTAKCELPWFYPQSPNWTKAEWHIMVWCGNAHAHVDLSPMFWNGSSHRNFPSFVLGYEDEEPAQPTIYDADELADWATLLAWLNAQPWREWTLPNAPSQEPMS